MLFGKLPSGAMPYIASMLAAISATEHLTVCGAKRLQGFCTPLALLILFYSSTLAKAGSTACGSLGGPPHPLAAILLTHWCVVFGCLPTWHNRQQLEHTAASLFVTLLYQQGLVRG